MKDEHDKKTADIFSESKPQKPKLLKNRYASFQRLHLQFNGKQTTASIETMLYEFLALKLEVHPHTREANKKIKDWVYERISHRKWEAGESVLQGVNFSNWIHKEILLFVVPPKLKEKFYNFDK